MRLRRHCIFGTAPNFILSRISDSFLICHCVCLCVCFLDSIVPGSIADNTNVFCASGNTISNDTIMIVLHAECRMIITHILRQDSHTHILVNILHLPQQYQPPLPPLSKSRSKKNDNSDRATIIDDDETSTNSQ